MHKSKTPSLHGAHLERFLKAQEISARAFSTALKQHSSHITRVLNGPDHLSQANLLVITTGIIEHPECVKLTSESSARDFARSLIVHWLRDHIPEGWETEIHILADEWSSVREQDQNIDPRAEAIAYLDDLSRKNPAVADWLIASRGIIQDPAAIDTRLATASAHREAAATHTSQEALQAGARAFLQEEKRAATAPARPGTRLSPPANQSRRPEI